MEIFHKILGWLRDVVPSVSAVAGMVYNYFMRRVNRLEQDKRNLKTELEYKENEDKVEKDNRGKSDDQLLDELLAESRRAKSDSEPGPGPKE